DLSLGIKNISNNKIDFITTTYIPNSNSVFIKLIEKFEDEYINDNSYTQNILLDLKNNESNLLTQVNIGFYRNYDNNTNIFTNDIISDKFNRFYPRYNLINYSNSIFIKIT